MSDRTYTFTSQKLINPAEHPITVSVRFQDGYAIFQLFGRACRIREDKFRKRYFKVTSQPN